MEESLITEWIVAVASIVTAAGVVFIGIEVRLSMKQLELMKMQYKADHERSRRERALDVLKHWNESVTITQPSARLLVEGFSHEQCEKLIANKEFSIGEDNLRLLQIALDNFADCAEPKIEGGAIHLKTDHLFRIGQQCMAFLNSLEIAVQAWHNNIADAEILEAELKYLVKPAKRYYVLQEFRDALGGTGAYPAIQSFVDHIKNSELSTKRKEKIAQ